MSTNPQSLLGKAKKAFQKAVISGMLLTSVVAGLGMTATTAEAQTYNNGVTVTQTVQDQQQAAKPWARDQNYVEQVRLIEEQSNLRMEAYMQKMNLAKANAGNWLAQQSARQQQQAKQARKGGWTFAEIHSTTAAANAALTRYNTTMNTYNIQIRQTQLREETGVLNAIARQDAYFARLSPYKEMLAEQAAANRPVVQQVQVQTTQKSANGVLTPDQMHDAFVKQYQQALLKGQNPDPAKYHLDPSDPAIQVTGAKVVTAQPPR